MIHDNSNISMLYLKSAELYINDVKADSPLKIKTVLGSCISVTMFHHRTRLAAICHAVLPRCLERNICKASCVLPYKYVDCVIHNMVSIFRKYGIHPRNIEVKLFGGADMFPLRTERERRNSVGRQNIEAAIKAIKSEEMRIKVADVGGEAGRKIFFYINNGDVWVKYLK